MAKKNRMFELRPVDRWEWQILGAFRPSRFSVGKIHKDLHKLYSDKSLSEFFKKIHTKKGNPT